VTGIVRSGNTLITAGYDGSIIWWNSETGEVRHRVDGAHAKWIRQLAISPDGATVASVGDDMQTKLWNSETGEPVASWDGYEARTPHGYPSMLYTVAFSPDGKWLATGNRTGIVLVRDVSTGEVAATIEAPVMYTWDPKARRHSIGGIRSVAFSHDSRLLAVGGMGQVGNIDHLGGNSRIEVFEWQTGERKYEIEDSKYKGLVEAMAFGPDDQWLVAAGGDNGGFVSVYNVDDGKLLAQEKAPMHVHDFELTNEGAQLHVVGYEQGCVVDLA
jgi:WD40 repeat protein